MTATKRILEIGLFSKVRGLFRIIYAAEEDDSYFFFGYSRVSLFKELLNYFSGLCNKRFGPLS